MRVLIVDDNEIVLELHRDMLQEAGYEVDTAEDGNQALEMLRSATYRVVVADWMMPGMNGLELCQAIRSRHFSRYIYFILVTSREAADDMVAGFDAGVDDFITKPVTPAELQARMRVGARILALENRDVTILALAKIAQSRDPDTGHHLERIRDYCRIIVMDLAQQEKFQRVIDGEYIEALYATSPLHDIGKVGIPDSILRKPGKLTESERQEMMKHTTLGAETLEATRRVHPEAKFLRMASEIALSHHERWDGTGYPNGLEGEEIPLCGRIVALADVYDALVSKRAYKDAFSHAAVRSMIIDASGQQFDPDVVDAFLRTEHLFVEVYQHHSPQAAATCSLSSAGI